MFASKPAFAAGPSVAIYVSMDVSVRGTKMETRLTSAEARKICRIVVRRKRAATDFR
jgi:hypothetical protein